MKKTALRVLSAVIAIVISASLMVGACALTGENYAVFSSTSAVTVPVNEHIGGDANGNGVVNIIDALAALRYIADIKTNVSRDGADANEDGIVSLLDVVLIIRYSIGDNVNLGNLVTVTE